MTRPVDFRNIPKNRSMAVVTGLLALGAAAAGTCLLLGACAGGPVGNKRVPQPARDVDLQQYLGRWYEMARYENRFERGCDLVTAEYSLREDGKVHVVNSCGADAQGKRRVAEGTAKLVDEDVGARNAKLKVSFFGPFYVGDYWILDHGDDYSWSIVGEPSGKYLWILTREAIPSEARRAMLLQRAEALGYDIRMLRSTRQQRPASLAAPAGGQEPAPN